MTVRRSRLKRSAVVHFEEALGVREAIDLPKAIDAIPNDEAVILDFRLVRELRASVAAALLAALNAIRNRQVFAVDLDRLDSDLSRLCRAA